MSVSPVGGPIFSDGWRAGSASLPDQGLFVSLVVFTYDYHWDLPGIAWAGYRLRRVWRRQEGGVRLRQWVQPMRRLMGALTVWDSEEALRSFLDGPVHRSVVRAFGDRVRGDHLHWLVGSFEADQTWGEACRRITESTPKRQPTSSTEVPPINS